MPRAPFRGSATRYDRRQLLWLLALRQLRKAERLPLTKIRARLQELSPSELETLATRDIAPGPLADALGIHPEPPLAAPPASLAEVMRAQLPRWSRVELALGLELHVRDGASPQTLELARRIQTLCLEQAEGE
jgi:hypothetical protein